MFNKEARLVADELMSRDKAKTLPDGIGYKITQGMITQEIMEQVRDVNVTPAYHSIADLEAQRLLQEKDQIANPAIDNLGLLLRHKILVPTDVNPNDAFKRAVNLAKEKKFQDARHELYAWQENIIAEGTPVEDAAAKMNELVEQYDDQVKETTNKNRKV